MQLLSRERIARHAQNEGLVNEDDMAVLPALNSAADSACESGKRALSVPRQPARLVMIYLPRDGRCYCATSPFGGHKDVKL